MIVSMAWSPDGRTHSRDCVLKGRDKLFGWRVEKQEMTIALSESGGLWRHDGTGQARTTPRNIMAT